MHAENGFIKIFPAGEDGASKVEASYSHPFSLNEFEFGTLKDGVLEIGATEEHHFQRPQVTADPDKKAKQVTTLKRKFWFDQETSALKYEVYLGVAGQDAKLHLTASLKK